MNPNKQGRVTKFSIVIPCFNEEKTLKVCVKRVMKIADESLFLEIIIVDDCSSDGSLSVARELESKHSEILVLHHEKNQGKGAALRTGFQKATGDFVAVQDADLEYDPMDLKRLLVPLINGDADVVFGSRFLSYGVHRVLYFWHYLGNRFLTFMSNMFTDLNLTDMETCYKVFRREVIQGIQIRENRFGFEPEIVAKVAQMRLRIFEMGISYYGRTYVEGKKIGVKDGFRALYCIFRYNAHKAPIPIQFLLYLFIGGLAAVVNLFVFLGMFSAGLSVTISAPTAFIAAAIVNYLLCIFILFRRTVRWNSTTELLFIKNDGYWISTDF
jgi:dolichol-phosphate mannosyltransferase